jgi:hypothetical protein
VSDRPAVARCSFLLLGEDSAAGARPTLETLAKKILRLVDGYHDTRHIRFEPLEPRPGIRLLRGNLWKSSRPEDYRDRRDLIGYIATKLLEGETSFVVFHIDGDRPWAERDLSENVAKFRDFIETDVRQFIEHRRRKQPGQPAPSEPSLSQLLLLVPFHSLEAWLFQNAELGRRLCREHPTCGGVHVALFDAWEQDRALLDEIPTAPKKQVCFESDHNHRLAESLDADAVFYAGKSFHATVEAFMTSAPLLRALEATRPA